MRSATAALLFALSVASASAQCLPKACKNRPLHTCSLETCTGIKSLVVCGQGLYGTIPSALGSLNVEMLFLGDNELSGTIPPSFGSLSSAKAIVMDFNDLHGSIPASFSSLHQLSNLDLYSNELTGPMPESLCHLSKMTFLDLSANELTGQIPASFGSMSALRVMYLDDNELTGEIPSSMGSLTNLFDVYLKENELTGGLPHSLSNLVDLSDFLVSDNMMSGAIPDSLCSIIGPQIGGCELDGGNFWQCPFPAACADDIVGYCNVNCSTTTSTTTTSTTTTSTTTTTADTRPWAVVEELTVEAASDLDAWTQVEDPVMYMFDFRGDLDAIQIRNSETSGVEGSSYIYHTFDAITGGSFDSVKVDMHILARNLNRDATCRAEVSTDGGATWLTNDAVVVLEEGQDEDDGTTGSGEFSLAPGDQLAVRMQVNGDRKWHSCFMRSVSVQARVTQTVAVMTTIEEATVTAESDLDDWNQVEDPVMYMFDFRGDINAIQIRNSETAGVEGSSYIYKTFDTDPSQFEAFVVEVHILARNLNRDASCRAEVSLDGGSTWATDDPVVVLEDGQDEDDGTTGTTVVALGAGDQLAVRLQVNGDRKWHTCFMKSVTVSGVGHSVAGVDASEDVVPLGSPSDVWVSGPFTSSTELTDDWSLDQEGTDNGATFSYRGSLESAFMRTPGGSRMYSAIEATATGTAGFQYFKIYSWVLARNLNQALDYCSLELSFDGGASWVDDDYLNFLTMDEIGGSGQTTDALVSLSGPAGQDLMLRQRLSANGYYDVCFLRAVSVAAIS